MTSLNFFMKVKQHIFMFCYQVDIGSFDVFNMLTHESGFKTSFCEVGSNMCALATTHESSFS